MEQEKTAVEVLREARRLISEKGWCQLFWSIKDGKGINQFPTQISPDDCAFCADGALLAVERRGRFRESYLLAERFLGKAIGPDRSVIAWNDDPSRTREEVIAAFDRAIALAEKG